jgi:DNA-binding response OmpR family regulator
VRKAAGTGYDAEEAATPVLSVVRRVAKEVRTLVGDLDALRSENEVLRADQEELLDALAAMIQRHGRRTGEPLLIPPAASRPGAGRRQAASAAGPRLSEQTAAGPGLPRDPVEVGRLRLDPGSHSVHVGGHEVPLAPREFDLLHYLLVHRGQVLTRETLFRAVWSTTFTGDLRTLRWHINAIRTKLERFTPLPLQITTLHRTGYRLDLVDDVGSPQ